MTRDEHLKHIRLKKRVRVLETFIGTLVRAEEMGEFTEGGSPWHYFEKAKKLLGSPASSGSGGT